MRGILILVGFVAVAVAAGVAVFIHGGFGGVPSGSSNLAAAAVSFTELVAGDHSNVEHRVNYLISSREELDSLWEMIETDADTPEIDFSTNSVIAVFAGEEPTSGYAISVSKVTDSESRVVSVTINAPSSDCTMAQTITAPYQIIVLPKTTLPLAHEDAMATVVCK